MTQSSTLNPPVRSSAPVWLMVMLVVSATTLSIGLITLAVKDSIASSRAADAQKSVWAFQAEEERMRAGPKEYRVKVQSDLSKAEVIPCPAGYEVSFDTLYQTYLTQFTFHIEEAKVKELRFKYEGGGFWSCNGKPYQGRYNLDVFTRSTTLRVTTEGSVVEEMLVRLKPS